MSERNVSVPAAGVSPVTLPRPASFPAPRSIMIWLVIVLSAVGGGPKALNAGQQLPNILWIVAEDINPHLGCYGDSYAKTPNLDRFAASGLRYGNCWSSAPVCAPARTALISGVYPTSLGAEHMRSEVTMPRWMRLYPQLLRERGYYCSNNSKEDYNVTKPGKVWDESSRKAHWRNRPAGQPFFAVFNIEVCHESQIRARPHTLKHDPARVRLPAYHPDTPEVRRDWAQYYDKITEMDVLFGSRLAELEQAGLLEDTIVFFFGDNGSGMPRSKRWPYNSGLNVPLIIRIPDKYKGLAPSDYAAGGATERLVCFVDFAPTLLSLAGDKAPDWMQGQAFLGRHIAAPAKYLHGFRGRMDERYDLVRSVRNGRYIYIRNYMPHLVYGQYLDYMFQTPTTRVWEQLFQAGRLQPPQSCFWESKPPEELYDLETDRDEVHNLAGSPQHQAILAELRAAHREHVLRIRDAGFLPEPEQHSRASAGGTSIYELAHEPEKYRLDRIVMMAEEAAKLEPEAFPRLSAGLKDGDSAVRYWAALGLYMRGSNAVISARQEFGQLLRDPAPAVRIVGASGLGKFGNEQEQAAAAETLKALAAPDQNGAYVSMMSLNAIQMLARKPAGLLDYVKSMTLKDPRAPDRANSYVTRLVSELGTPELGARPAQLRKNDAGEPTR